MTILDSRKSHVLFSDSCAYKPYDLQSLDQAAMGGSEATLIRIVSALKENDKISVSHEIPRFFKAEDSFKDHVVCMRNAEHLPALRKRFPKAKLHLWLHDFCDPKILSHSTILKTNASSLICVSEHHKMHTVEMLKSQGYQGEYPVKRIFNPVDDKLGVHIYNASYDPFRLIFMSSPHKGLNRTLEIFQGLRYSNPRYTLKIANPGYYPDAKVHLEGVEVMGSLPHAELMSELGASMCMLHVNTVFPETFGIVYAEALAMRTPFISHRWPAVREISDDVNLFVDCNDADRVIQKVIHWSEKGRPSVSLDPKFRTYNIVKDWIELLAAKSH